MMYGRGLGFGNMMGGLGWAGALAIGMFTLIFITGVILLIIWATRAASGSRHDDYSGQVSRPETTGYDEAVAIARRRLAAGEISGEQYQEIISTLQR